MVHICRRTGLIYILLVWGYWGEYSGSADGPFKVRNTTRCANLKPACPYGSVGIRMRIAAPRTCYNHDHFSKNISGQLDKGANPSRVLE